MMIIIDDDFFRFDKDDVYNSNNIHGVRLIIN